VPQATADIQEHVVTLGDHLRALAAKPEDTERPALVVQGGGLRGVYSMAALAVLEELDLRDAFSVVVGSSAGAINGAYFLAHQARESVQIYTEDLSSCRFISPWRVWRIVDVDYMIDVALKEHHPLDERELHAAPAAHLTVVTDAMTGQPRVVSAEEPVDLYEVFRATAALPGLYNKKVAIDGRPAARRYVDGGVASLLPLDVALQHSKQALVLLTRPEGYRRCDQSLVFRILARTLSRGQSPAIRARLGAADPAFNEAMEVLEAEELEAQRATWTLRPSDPDRLVSRTTNEAGRLRACAELAREDMLRLLEQPCAIASAHVAHRRPGYAAACSAQSR
jgi:predicted patatin/cPLA2 family phospholipase